MLAQRRGNVRFRRGAGDHRQRLLLHGQRGFRPRGNGGEGGNARDNLQPVRAANPLQQKDPGAEQHGVAEGDKPDLPARRHLLGQRRGNVVPHRLFFRAVGAHRKMAAADLRVCAQVLAYDGERQAVAAFAAGWRIQHIQLAEDPRRTHGDQIGRPRPAAQGV